MAISKLELFLSEWGHSYLFFASEQRQYKNNSDLFEQIPPLKLPRFFNHRMFHAWANLHVFFRNVNKNKLEEFYYQVIEFH